MEIVLTYFLLILATICHLILDLHKQKVKHPIIHWLSALIVFLVSSTLGFANQIFTDYQWWQFTIYSLCIHLALFDPIWNIAHKEDWWYSGTPSNPNRAWTDRIWGNVPPLGQLLFRPWFILFGIGWYYHLDLIIGS